jgi:endonuclease G
MIFKTLLLSSIFTGIISTGAYADNICSNSLPYGLPVITHDDFLISAIKGSQPVLNICHTGYYSAYSAQYKLPIFVAWTLTSDHSIGCIQRDKVNGDRFQHDPAANGTDANPSEYSKSGYDTGHLADAGDFDWDMKEFIESFYMTNMTPQVPGLNRGGWKTVEGWTRIWAHDRGEILVYTGPVIDPSDEKLANDIDIPKSFWKVIYDAKKNEAIAFLMPNQKVDAHSVGQYIVSISNIESLTHITLPLPSSYDKNKVSNLNDWSVNTTAFLHAKQSFCAINHPNQ